MSKIFTDKKQKALLFVIAFFELLKSFYIFDYHKTGLSLSSEFFLFPAKNLTFDILTIIYCLIFSYILIIVLNKFGKEILPLLLLIIADPKFTVFQSDFVELFVGILMLVCILIIANCSANIGNISLWIFCAIAGSFLPMSVFTSVPVVLLINYFNQNKKDRKIVSAFIGLFVFAVFSVIRIAVFKNKQYVLDSFMQNYSDGFDFRVSVGHTFFTTDIASYLVTVLSIVFIVYSLYLKNKCINKTAERQFKTDSAVIIFTVLISVFGEIVYYNHSVVYLIAVICWIMLIKDEDVFAVKYLKKLNAFIDKYPFILVFALLLLSYSCMLINGVSSFFNTVGFDFVD